MRIVWTAVFAAVLAGVCLALAVYEAVNGGGGGEGEVVLGVLGGGLILAVLSLRQN